MAAKRSSIIFDGSLISTFDVIWRKISVALSLRGLSLVKIATSLPLASACPIRGRLVASRSPPQPNTAITFPVVNSRAAASTFSTASGECA